MTYAASHQGAIDLASLLGSSQVFHLYIQSMILFYINSYGNVS